MSKSTLTFSGSQDSTWVNRDLIEFRFYKHKKRGWHFMKSWSILQENKSDDSLFFIAWINILSELRGNVREKSKNSTGKHFHQAQLCPFTKNPSKSPCHCAVMAYWLAHLFFPFKLIKKPKNGLLPSFSLDFTWNRQIWSFYTEKWIFFKHLGTLLKLTKLHFRPQSPLVSGSINICRPARWDAWINLDHYVGF